MSGSFQYLDGPLPKQGLGQPDPTRKYTGETAVEYDAKREESEKWIVEQRIVTEMLSDLPPRSSVLDVPCGTGRFLGFYHQQKLRVLAMDISADMIAQAVKKVPDPLAMIDGKAQFTFQQGDIRRIDTVGDNSVDAAVMVRMTRWLSPEDCQKAFDELQRVARDRIILTTRTVHSSRPDVARPVSLFNAVQKPGWMLAHNAAGHEEAYRVLMFQKDPTS